MNIATLTIYTLVILMGFGSLFAATNSGNSSTAQPNTVQKKNTDDPKEIIVRFEKDKTVPDIPTSERVSVDFVNEEIKNVLRYTAELYDLNIIIPTSLTGNVTLRLKDVEWEALLNTVLTPLGYSYSENKGIIQVVSESMAKQEPLQTKTFVLKFADAKTVANELKDFVDKEAKEKLSFNERTNILIWTGRGKNLSTIEEIITKLDKPETQVMIEAKFIEANNSITDSQGFKWPSGLEIYWDDQGAGTKTSTDTNGTTTTSSETKHGQLTYGLNGSKFFKGSTVFIQTLQGTFDFSKTDSIGKTLSNPTIITMNNVPASMSVITNYPIPNYSYNSEQKTYEISGFEEKPVGLELKVTPKVQSKYITLQLEPSLSEQTGSVVFQAQTGTNVSYPQIKEKKASSTITIESGRSIAIGGLMSENTQNTKTKTPFFGDIPLFGNIFSHKDKSKNISNLLIFLSATQVAYDGTIIYPTLVGAKNVSDKKLFEMGMTERDLPGETEISDKEKELYAQLRALQTKLDNITVQQKANAQKEKLSQSLQTPMNPEGKPLNRAAKLYKQQRYQQ